MDSVTLAWVFGAVWLGLALLFCCFKVSGGRLVDILACECFRGPCCDCWGNGGEIDRYDREWPYRPSGLLNGGYPGQSTLPPIVIVNRTGGGESDDDEESVGERGSERGKEAPASVLDAESRSEAEGALLLRNRESKRESVLGPIVV